MSGILDIAESLFGKVVKHRQDLENSLKGVDGDMVEGNNAQAVENPQQPQEDEELKYLRLIPTDLHEEMFNSPLSIKEFAISKGLAKD